MKKNNLIALAAASALVVGTIGGAYAWYSGTSDTKANTFSIAAGEAGAAGAEDVGEVLEPNWVEPSTNLMPNQQIDKDPSFKLAADYEAWCILGVKIPKAEILVEGDTETTPYAQEAVELVGLDTNKWSLITNATDDTDDAITYYYGYNETLDTDDKTPAPDTTSELFQAIKVKNITKLEKTKDCSVDVTAHIVQKEGNADLTAAATALGLIN